MSRDRLRSPGAVNAKIPNALTVGRIVITPVMVVALAEGTKTGNTIGALVFAVASITDFVDGYLARRANVISSFGKLMDPIADKLLVVGALIPLVANHRLAAWVAVVILVREALVTITRFQVKRGGGEVIAAAQLGKLKTVIQLWAILFVIIWTWSPILVKLVVYVAVILTVVSAIDFYWRTFRGGDPEEAPVAGDDAAVTGTRS